MTLSHHHYPNLSESIELKNFVGYILSSVYLILNPFSQLSWMHYMGLCDFSLPITVSMIVRMVVLYFILLLASNRTIWINSHCSGLSQETIVCAVGLTMSLFMHWPLTNPEHPEAKINTILVVSWYINPYVSLMNMQFYITTDQSSQHQEQGIVDSIAPINLLR